ncbi:hypothetical protein F5I97DRAFT_1846273 [Phlebopus sp. FC_14]|nr:hypothetical protein F5I97DRAFT_1846273 [Phlebopus sp. FC_14]
MRDRKESRCNLFDDNGRPRLLKDGTKGCPRDASDCYFVHPHEREWRTAKSSYPPRRDSVADSDSKFYYVLADHHTATDRDRRSSETLSFDNPGSYSHRDLRRESTDLISGGSRSPQSTRRAGVNMGNSNVRRSRDRSPAHSTSSDQLVKPHRDEKHAVRNLRTHPLDARRSEHSRSSDREYPPARSRSRERDDRNKPTSPPRGRGTDNRDARAGLPPRFHPPPEPSKASPAQPPPPLPSIRAPPSEPTFIAHAKEHPLSLPKFPKTLSMEEQRKIWHERVDLMFASVATRQDYSKISNDLDIIRLVSSSRVSTLPPPDIARINAQKEHLEQQMEEKRKEINAVIQKLMGTAWWPALKMPELLEMEKAYGEVKKHVAEVRTSVEELYSTYSALHKLRAAASTTSLPAPGLHAPHDSERPLKRRRVSEDPDVGKRNVTPDAQAKEHEHAQLEIFRDKLTALDHHLINLENDISQRDQIISDEIELRIDGRFEDEDLFSPQTTESVEVSPADIEAVVDRKNETLVRTVDATGVEIGELAKEVGELITQINELENRCHILEKENQELRNVVAECLTALDSQENAKTDKEIQALNAALQALILQPSCESSSITPAVPTSSLDYILDSINSQVDNVFREKFSPSLIQIREELSDKVQENHLQIYDTVFPKLRLLIHMLQLVTTHFDRADTVRGGSTG